MSENICDMHEKLMAEFGGAERLKMPSGHPIDIMQRETAK